ncbi:MAG: hypothetical protein M3Q69_09610 [Acidobacteriota bacterium]|nr:hypothetical protein [Acidobacteriota bacterium]
MIRFSLRRLPLFLLAAALAVPAMALNVVNTSAPQINCVFTTTTPCTVSGTDYVSTFMGGAARLQSRIYQGAPGSTAAYKWVYQYRIDLTQVAGVTYPPSADQLAIYNFGPVLHYDYDFNGSSTDEVFNIASGGLGTKGVTSAYYSGSFLYFVLGSAVFAGSYPGGGESSYFFGVVSDYAPVLRTVWVHTDSGWVSMTGYAPQYP